MDLLEKLTPDTVVLTPNRRLSASLLKKYAALQIATGKTSWTSPTILPLSTWLETLWKNYTLEKFTSHPFILDTNQEQFLWEAIVKKSEENNALMQISSTAELAKSAFTILKQWQIKSGTLENNDNTVIYKKWAQSFEALCSKRNFLDKNSLVEVLIEKIYTGEIYLPKEIVLYGFAEISPLYQALLTTCENANCKILHYHPENVNQATFRVKLRDEDAEIYSMARFAKARYKENPEQTIGCVVPNLEKLRDKVLRIFSEVFCEANTFTLSHIELPFNISAGMPLTQYPVIYAAVQWLQLFKEAIGFPTWSFLLRSPFLGGAEKEFFTRTQLENLLRRKNVMTLSLKKFLTLAGDSCPELTRVLADFLSHANETQEEKYASEWVTLFTTLLNALGWPGDRSLTSSEYQVTQEWLHLLTEFTVLDHTIGKMHYSTALDYLMQSLNNRIFQIESPDRPIQILGILEAADMPFDHLWVMGLDDSVWPPLPKPNPYIPYALQRSLQMPHATAIVIVDLGVKLFWLIPRF